MAPWLRALATLAEDQASTPSMHIVAPKPLELQFQGIHRPLLVSVGTACPWCTDYLQTFILHTKINKPIVRSQIGAENVPQWVEYLPSTYEALGGSILSTP